MYEEKSHVGMFQCYFCGKDAGILLDKRLRKSLPMHAGVVNMDPCGECKEFMKQGVILISIENDTTPEEMGKGGTMPNPRITGRFSVVKDEAIEKIFDEASAKFALKHRFMFVTDAAWHAIGLPTTYIDNRK